MQTPRERVIFFEEDPFFSLPKRYIQLKNEFKEMESYVEVRIGECLELLDRFGPWLVDRAIELGVEQLSINLKQECGTVRECGDTGITNEFSHLFSDEVDVLLEKSNLMMEAEAWGKNALPPTSNDLTTKINALVNLLSEFDDEDFCGIIFVKERMTAHLLSMCLQRHERLTKFNVDCVVGHGNSKGTRNNLGHLLRMKFQQQQKVLARFAKGELNLLVATQVAEEGIDVNPCNVVIRYDLGDTLINYIQSRGRGRSSNAQFIILAPASDAGIISKVEMFHTAEAKINSILNERTNINHKPYIVQSFTIQENGITINLENCEWMLDEYCSLLPKDGFCIFWL
jgi:endoribonuclease Dicer